MKLKSLAECALEQYLIHVFLRVPTDLQPMLYCGAVAASNDPTNTTIQDFLLEEYVRNRGARQRSLIVNALACDQVEENLQQYDKFL